MIARVWHGWARPENADDYEAEFRSEVLPGLNGLEGCLGAHLLRRRDADEVEFVAITYFASEDAVRRFAGDDLERAVVSARAREVLSRFDERAHHYQVAIHP